MSWRFDFLIVYRKDDLFINVKRILSIFSVICVLSFKHVLFQCVMWQFVTLANIVALYLHFNQFNIYIYVHIKAMVNCL